MHVVKWDKFSWHKTDWKCIIQKSSWHTQ